MRVLYVDDDRVHLLLFVEACRVAGSIEVETAETGAEALDLVREWVPDLLVIDLHLPDASGYALLPELRRRIGMRPAFLCTADEAKLVDEPARAAGFDGCWTKPVAVQTVRAEFERLGADRQCGGRAG
jgi:two-component system, OmpR family, response regulator